MTQVDEWIAITNPLLRPEIYYQKNHNFVLFDRTDGEAENNGIRVLSFVFSLFHNYNVVFVSIGLQPFNYGL